MSNPKLGKFIVFEGIDNSGKTTVASAIKEWLQTRSKINAVLTKHPGSTPIGYEVRQLLKHSPHDINPNAQALLFAADNSLFIHQILLPSIKQGQWVIGDRNNFISSIAYQIASGCSFDELDQVHAATLSPPEAKIDILFIFRCSWEETQRRRQQKGLQPVDRYEDQGKDYFNKLVNTYETLLETQTDRLNKFVRHPQHCYYIDATRPLPEVISEVQSRIKLHLENIVLTK